MAKSRTVRVGGSTSTVARRRASASASASTNGASSLVTLDYLRNDYGRDEVAKTTVPDLGNRVIYYLPKRVASISFVKFFDVGSMGERVPHAVHIIRSIVCNEDGSPLFSPDEDFVGIPLEALSSMVLAIVDHRFKGMKEEVDKITKGN